MTVEWVGATCAVLGVLAGLAAGWLLWHGRGSWDRADNGRTEYAVQMFDLTTLAWQQYGRRYLDEEGAMETLREAADGLPGEVFRLASCTVSELVEARFGSTEDGR